MRCPSLKELPSPPQGKVGWPWTTETPALPESGPDGKPWPKFSLVTPSFNQGEFIEATIRSVLLQGYPNIEYMIMDGGSADESVGIIKKYEPWLTGFVSEKDRGQSHAINKGLERATGGIFQWINSDDRLKPGALEIVAQSIFAEPDAVAWAGDCARMDTSGKVLNVISPRGLSRDELADWATNYIYQPAIFMSLDAIRKVGPLDESLFMTMDMDLILRLTAIGRLARVNGVLAEATIHKDAKTQARRPQIFAEQAIVQCRYGYEHIAKKLITDIAASDWRFRTMIGKITSTGVYRILRPLLKAFGLVGEK